MPNVVGVDEVGYGAWAGPLVVCALAFKPSLPQSLYEEIRDSKKIAPKKRQLLATSIKAHAWYQLAWVPPETIDTKNVLRANLDAIEDLLCSFPITIDAAYIDGRYAPGSMPFPCTPLVGGDATHKTIGAASIVAKSCRDQAMEDMEALYPDYGWASHKGYGTKKHLQALEKLGLIQSVHRRSFLKKYPHLFDRR